MGFSLQRKEGHIWFPKAKKGEKDFMGWFDSIKSPKLKSVKKNVTQTPSGFWKKCTACGEILQVSKLEESLHVCPYCDFHFRYAASDRLKLIVDEGSFEYFGMSLTSSDPLKFKDKKDYKERLEDAEKNTGYKDGT